MYLEVGFNFLVIIRDGITLLSLTVVIDELNRISLGMLLYAFSTGWMEVSKLLFMLELEARGHERCFWNYFGRILDYLIRRQAQSFSNIIVDL